MCFLRTGSLVAIISFGCPNHAAVENTSFMREERLQPGDGGEYGEELRPCLLLTPGSDRRAVSGRRRRM